jgi:prepilin-type N-terminal cleavage/methylation domain-containing protein
MTSRYSEGFTLIELLVTLVLGTALMFSFFALYRTGVSMSLSASRQEIARNLAYKKLRQYSQVKPVAWTAPGWVCDSTTRKSSTGERSILTTAQQTVTEPGLPNPVKLTINATAPHGCDSTEATMPILVEVTVEYGPTNQKVVYATYAEK